MTKRTRVRLTALAVVAFTAGVLAISIERGWFAQEDAREPSGWLGRRRLPMCGFVRGLPVLGGVADPVPCQVWNLFPLTIVAAACASWLVRDGLKSAAFAPAAPRNPREAAALTGAAQLLGGAVETGERPLFRFPVAGGHGEASFDAGKRRFRLGRHVRVRIPLRRRDLTLRIAPPMQKFNRRQIMVYPSPGGCGDPSLDSIYDIHASSPAVLSAALAGGAAEQLRQLHPRLWMLVDRKGIEVRLAGDPHERLVTSAVTLARELHARLEELVESRS